MTGKHLSAYKINKIVLCFCEDITASSTATIVGVNRNTINAYFSEFRKLIFNEELRVVGKETGIFEVDESYFGAKRVRGKRGRGAAGKTPVFGLLKRGEKVYVQIIPNCSRENILPIIEGKVTSGSVIHSDGWKAYDGINLNGYEHHRVFHSENEFVRGKYHVKWDRKF